MRFQYNHCGKPALINELDGDIIRFNLSHSDEFAVYALSYGREVGIDVERVRDDVPSAGVAGEALSHQEIAAFRRLPTHLQAEAFFKYWVCKEAYLKAKGIGFSNQLSRFISVSLLPDEQGELLKILEISGEASGWSIALFGPAPDYVGAVAKEGKDWHLRCQPWAISNPPLVSAAYTQDPVI
ncbi:MAG: 4'-phosphopantetheinyl transferase superfamily protein [Gammaproteobacteria bacterium]